MNVAEEEIEVADDSVVVQAIQKAQTFGQTESDQDVFSLSQSQGKGWCSSTLCSVSELI